MALEAAALKDSWIGCGCRLDDVAIDEDDGELIVLCPVSCSFFLSTFQSLHKLILVVRDLVSPRVLRLVTVQLA